MARRWRTALLIVLALLGAAALFRALRDAPPAPAALATRPATRAPAARPPAAALVQPVPPPVGDASDSPTVDVVALLDDALLALRTAASPAAAAGILAHLRAELRAAPPTAAAAAVVDFLAGGADAATGLPFAVGAEGVLASAPSLRVALLDVLPALDPDAALATARIVMDARTSSDEYAVSLRNLAWNDFEGDMRAEMATRFEAMLTEKPWRAQPGAAFLEAFDVAVALGDRAAVDALAGVITPGASDRAGRALNRAAFIALDRIALRDPALLVDVQAAPPAVFVTQPDLRASLLSRLDITDPAQRASFSAYLADPGLSTHEREYFAELFPNGNYTQGQRLVTAPETTPDIAQRSAMDARIDAELASLAGVTPPGPARDTITRIRARLARYLEAPR